MLINMIHCRARSYQGTPLVITIFESTRKERERERVGGERRETGGEI